MPFGCLSGPVDPLAAQKLDDLSDDPEVARKLMQLPDGFEAQLVASEPTIVNPLQINFDSRGRLYVLCVPRYPQILPGQAPNDYVVMLDDFDKTGKARKSRVVVDGLMVPTGMMPGDGGVYVGQAEALLHFREPKGDGKFEKRTLLTGFGTADTHHTLNTFRWGPDGSLYFNQGLYIHSTVETPYGPRKLFGGCIWQLRTDRLKLEVYDRSITPQQYLGPRVRCLGAIIHRQRLARRHQRRPARLAAAQGDAARVGAITQDDAGRRRALRYCGLEVVSGRHFPDDWQGEPADSRRFSVRTSPGIYRYAALNDDGQPLIMPGLCRR